MTTSVAERGPSVLGALRDRHPQWWLWPLAAAGWTALGGLSVARLAGPSADGHGSHGVYAGIGQHAVAGVAMVAVMAPLIAQNVRFAARRSPRRVRVAITRDVAAGWALPWVAATVGLGAGGAVLAGVLGDQTAVALLTAVAVSWQYTTTKRRSLARCHARFAPPLNRARSGPACRDHGRRLGRDCVLSCAPLMGLVVVAAHDPFVAAAAMLTLWYERRRPHHDPATRPTAVAIAATGTVAFAVLALL